MFEDQPFLLPAIIAGGAFLLLLVMVIVFKRYYHPCEMDEAIVRTGAGGPKVSVQGAMFVIPTFHNVQRVTLRSMKLDVTRKGVTGDDAIRTADYLPVSLDAEVYVHIPGKPEYILAAARTLGEAVDPKGGLSKKQLKKMKASDAATLETRAQEAITNLTQNKLISAVRGVVASLTLEELHGDSQLVTDKVTEILSDDLRENGLEIEAIAIESLQPEDLVTVESRKDSNVFDAEAYKALVDRRERNATQANQIMQTNKAQRETDDKDYEVTRLDLEKQRRVAAEVQNKDILNETAKNKNEAQAYMAEAEQMMRERVAVAITQAENVESQKLAERESVAVEAQKDFAIRKAECFELSEIAQKNADQAVETKEQDVLKNVQIAVTEKDEAIGVRISEGKEKVAVRKEQADRDIGLAETQKRSDLEVAEQARLEAGYVKEREAKSALEHKYAAEERATIASEQIENARTRAQLQRVKGGEIERSQELKVAELLALVASQSKIARTRHADAGYYEQERLGAGAEHVLEVGKAEAESNRLAYLANMIDADVALKMAEARLLDKDSVYTYLVAKNLPEIVNSAGKHLSDAVTGAFKPLEAIDGMRIIQVNSDGNDNGSPMGSLMKNLVQAAPLGSMLNEVLNATETDVSLKDVVQKFVNVGNAVKNELVDKAVGGVQEFAEHNLEKDDSLDV